MKRIIYALLLVLVLMCGIHIGAKYQEARSAAKYQNLWAESDNKVNTLLELVKEIYVDSVSTDSLIEAAIPPMLSKLDPHSVYLNEKDRQSANEDLQGSFSGIGVQFSIENDTIMISNVLSGGPCQKKGILAGDRIVKVDSVDFTGKGITSDKVVSTLRGLKGTKVKLGIKRAGQKDLLEYDIIRDDITVSSIDVSYMIDEATGFVRVNKFGEKTHAEFMNAMAGLKQSGAKRYIIDLRDNGGGYLDQATLMVNEFLQKGDLIVYTEGRIGRDDTYADGNGQFKDAKFVVLINEWSASASEIFSGAMQDNDRAAIVGRRSFGKGLVQQQYDLDAKSSVRLTVARYYTPSGRCIQKPYTNYSEDISKRYENGEMEDSSKYTHDTTESKYTTKKGRIVYGGGGITPDVFVPIEKEGINSYYTALCNKALYDFAFNYADQHRAELTAYGTPEKMADALADSDIEEKLADFAAEKAKIRKNSHMLQQSRQLLKRNINLCLARNIFGDQGYFILRNKTDNMVSAAIKSLDEQH